MDNLIKIKKPIIGFPIISLINNVFEIEGYTHTAEAVPGVVVRCCCSRAHRSPRKTHCKDSQNHAK